MKRKVTMRDMEALIKSVDEVRKIPPEIENAVNMSFAVSGGALANGDADSALNATLAGAAIMFDKIDKQYEPAMRKFERAVANFLGEVRGKSESDRDFMRRMDDLIDGGGSDMAALQKVLETQAKNGITWVRT